MFFIKISRYVIWHSVSFLCLTKSMCYFAKQFDCKIHSIIFPPLAECALLVKFIISNNETLQSLFVLLKSTKQCVDNTPLSVTGLKVRVEKFEKTDSLKVVSQSEDENPYHRIQSNNWQRRLSTEHKAILQTNLELQITIYIQRNSLTFTKGKVWCNAHQILLTVENPLSLRRFKPKQKLILNYTPNFYPSPVLGEKISPPSPLGSNNITTNFYWLHPNFWTFKSTSSSSLKLYSLN